MGRIAAKTVERMREEFGCDPRDMIVGIGPSIGPCCFEVGEEVVEAALEGLGDLKGLVETGKHPGGEGREQDRGGECSAATDVEDDD